MSYWNYRIIKSDVDTFAIHEVHYNSEDIPVVCTEKPVSPWGTSVKELEDDINFMIAAFGLPVLQYPRDFEGSKEDD